MLTQVQKYLKQFEFTPPICDRAKEDGDDRPRYLQIRGPNSVPYSDSEAMAISIAKWIMLFQGAKATQNVIYDMGAYTCGLCMCHLETESTMQDSCVGCPISKTQGMPSCIGTPYPEARMVLLHPKVFTQDERLRFIGCEVRFLLDLALTLDLLATQEWDELLGYIQDEPRLKEAPRDRK